MRILSIFFILALNFNILFADKKFVIIIPSYNNEKWCEQNLISALDQSYNNYKIIFIDDCSSDNNLTIAKKTIKNHPKRGLVKINANKSRVGAMENIYNAVHSCQDSDIIVMLDGDDKLSHRNVLTHLNNVYTNQNVYLTYGNYISLSNRRAGISTNVPESVIVNRSYRTHPFIFSHLKTFYAGLFKKIKLEDLMYDGKFLSVCSDLAFMYPMLEMADGKVKYIQEVNYVYNNLNDLNDAKKKMILQRQMTELLRNKPKYAPLSDQEFLAIKS